MGVLLQYDIVSACTCLELQFGAKTRPITHCTKIVPQSEPNESCVRPITVVVIRILLCFPRTVSAALPKVLLLFCPTVPVWTLSSLGPDTRRGQLPGGDNTLVVVGRYLLLLFMVLQNVFDLLRERLKAKPLRSSQVNYLQWVR